MTVYKNDFLSIEYIIFIQNFSQKNPGLSRKNIVNAWKVYREVQVKHAKDILQEMF